MKEINGIDRMHAFVNDFDNVSIRSTGAKIVNFSDDLYNVQGSTEDPKKVPGHQGDSWKRLLIEFAGLRKESCYVSNVNPPKSSSHPKFSVGGHMTTRRNGSVDAGGVSYLMPLCSWHNSTSRDEKRFTHTKTKMIELSGYMQGELASTFMARNLSDDPYVLVYYDFQVGNWKRMNMSKKQAVRLSSEMRNTEGDQILGCHVLIEKQRNKDSRCFVREFNLPKKGE